MYVLHYAGLQMADRVVTVAPSYKDEIMTVEGAWGMHEVTRSRCVRVQV